MTGDDTPEDLFEHAPCGYLTADADGLIRRANRTFLDWTGYEAGDIEGASRFSQLLTAGARIFWESHCAPLLRMQGMAKEVILELRLPGGGRRPVMVTAELRDGDRGGGRTLRIITSPAEDRVLYERELRAARASERGARERIEHLQRITEALAATADPAHVAELILRESLDALPDAAGAVLLAERGEWVTVARRGEGAEPPPELLLRAAAAQAPVSSGDARDWVAPMQADGRLHGLCWVHVHAPHGLGDDDRAFLDSCAGQGGQALERGRLFQALSELAGTDDLTGLPNRRAWDAVALRELSLTRRTGRPLSVAMLDLDHFKAFNDAHGHPAGDRLLRAVADVWTGVLRPGDMLARYGGEEFALLLIDCDMSEGLACTDRLRRCLPDGVSCSAGVAQCTPGETLEDALERADAALYRAKHTGRDRVEPAVAAG